MLDPGAITLPCGDLSCATEDALGSVNSWDWAVQTGEKTTTDKIRAVTTRNRWAGILCILLFVGVLGKRPAAEFPLPQSRPVEIHVDQIHKTQKKWNGAGTFGLLATLKKMNDVKNAAEGLRGLSGRTEYD
jgi:hypothetical protein